MASDGAERIARGKAVEGAALFGSGAASASAGASVALSRGSQSSGAVKSAHHRDWSGPLRVSQETIVAQPVPTLPFEAAQPDNKNTPSPEGQR